MELLGSFGDVGLSLAGTILAFLFVLTVIVFVHEMGHFLAARWCGMGVSTFSVGFGPELFGFNDRKGTRWKLSAVPLGGYVKFLGDENEASAADRNALAAMTPEERSRTFAGKSVGARAFVVAAGPAANFVLAIVIFTVMLLISGRSVVAPRIDYVAPAGPAAAAGFEPGDVVIAVDGTAVEGFAEVEKLVTLSPGRPLTFTVDRNGAAIELTAIPDSIPAPSGYDVLVGTLGIGGPARPPVVTQIVSGSAAAGAGLEVGDIIRLIDGQAISNFEDISEIVGPRPGQAVTMVIDRGGVEHTVTLTPRSEEGPDGQAIGRIGVIGGYAEADMKQVTFGPIAAAWDALKETWSIVQQTFTSLGRIISGQESASQLGGPLMIAKVSGDAAALGFPTLLRWAAFLSVSIGLINLFPIPILDGGHLLFFAFEAVRGRPLNERVQEVGFRIGLVLVLALMLFVLRNDIFIHLGIF